MDKNSNEYVLLIGASGGIGIEILTKLVAMEYKVVATYNTFSENFLNKCKNYNSTTENSVIPIRLDLTSSDSRNAFIQNLLALEIRPKAIIFASGFASGSFFNMTSSDALRANFEINFFGPYALTQMVSKMMKKNNGGSVVFISTVAVKYPQAGMSAYGSSKAALSYLTKSLAIELSSFGIRVNEVIPGLTRTPMLASMEPQAYAAMLSRVSMGRVGEPKEIADVVTFLIGENSTYVSGASIEVTGGFK